MVEPLKCIYYTFIDTNVSNSNKQEYDDIVKAHGVSKAGKARLWSIVENLKKKTLTLKGVGRKKRIVRYS